MPFTTLFFDLDDTLYPSSSGIWDAIGNRMEHYMADRLAIPSSIVHSERRRLFNTHGTTMRGLVAEYGIDDVAFLDYVHDIPINDFLSENIPLRKAIETIPIRKVIFTNANSGHANRVLKALGIEDLFEQVIDILDIKPWCKPQIEAFSTALQLAGIHNPQECVMIDDAYRNLVTAHELGLYTVQVGSQDWIEPVDQAIMTLEQLPDVLPMVFPKEKYV